MASHCSRETCYEDRSIVVISLVKSEWLQIHYISNAPVIVIPGETPGQPQDSYRGSSDHTRTLTPAILSDILTLK